MASTFNASLYGVWGIPSVRFRGKAPGQGVVVPLKLTAFMKINGIFLISLHDFITFVVITAVTELVLNLY